MAKRRKLFVTVPPAVHDEVLALAERLSTSQSQAASILIMRGLESMQNSENPFRKPDKA